MVQETFDILMDQVRHLSPTIDYLMMTLDTRWDPKAKRIYNPKAETQEQSEPATEDHPKPIAKEHPEVLAEQQTEETVGGEVRCEAAEFATSAFSVALWVIFALLSNRAPRLFGIFRNARVFIEFDDQCHRNAYMPDEEKKEGFCDRVCKRVPFRVPWCCGKRKKDNDKKDGDEKKDDKKNDGDSLLWDS
ncbi:hypothetical protein PIB30_068041 [Stylosanthes scabra]|uniref:Uncharacterized protein n=1 Tax=Stylosanthes scabra TaxID=79078 RepID=A0ABU6WR30_9FABA|nr:hypothetical protein [Stylosanthes scabra]